MNYIKNKRLLALIGIVCLTLGVFLPYYTLSFLGFNQNISLWGYWEGKVILLLVLANTLFIFKDYIEKYVPQLFKTSVGQKVANIKNNKLSYIPTILVVIFVIYLNTKFNFNSAYLKNGLGFYLLWVGIVFLALHPLLSKGSNNLSVNMNANNIMPNAGVNPINQTMAQNINNNINQAQPVIENNPQNNISQNFNQQPVQQPVQVQQPLQQPNTIEPSQDAQLNQGLGLTKFCPNCGIKLSASANFCPSCGNKFN